MYRENLEKRKRFTIEDYLEMMRTGDLGVKAQGYLPHHALRPWLYRDIPGVALLAPVNARYTAEDAGFLDYFRTAEGLSVSQSCGLRRSLLAFYQSQIRRQHVRARRCAVQHGARTARLVQWRRPDADFYLLYLCSRVRRCSPPLRSGFSCASGAPRGGVLQCPIPMSAYVVTVRPMLFTSAWRRKPCGQTDSGGDSCCRIARTRPGRGHESGDGIAGPCGV